MQKKLRQYLTAIALSSFFAFSLCFSTTQVYAEQVPIKVLNSRGNAGLPEYLHLQTTDTPGYNKYVNHRFGFSSYISAEMEGCFLPQNGDGASFLSPDDVTIVVSGMFNVLNETVESKYEETLKSHHQLTYKDRGKDWFAISYENELKGIIIYEKHFVNKDFLNTLQISYPMIGREHYIPMLEVVKANFIPSWGNQNS